MFAFRKATPAKSVMFAVSFDDGRTAYFVVPNHGGPSEDYLVLAIAKEQQEAGQLPEGHITSVRRVR
ncbi:hypothetical protein [Microvirga flavescens]|uniref:hypothetical protein n=1 Tax=Microvirga flavescens TaxID=2249811 RepID=UPI000DD6EE9F|nr:hypothetical protein [Microvirga flavescens]